MKEYVKRFIKANFNTENAGFFIEIANEFNLKDLEKDCQRYILSNPLLTPQELYVFGDIYVNSGLLKYDSRTEQWMEMPPMPYKWNLFAYATVNHQIYFCWSENVEQIFGGSGHIMLDTNTQEWTTGLPIMNHPRIYCSMAALGGYLYVAGGSGDNGENLSIVERYCIATGKWEDVSPMIHPRFALKLIELNGFLYAIGGHGSLAEKYDPQTDHWEYIASTNHLYSDFGSAVLDDRIYIVGQNTFEVYDSEANIWTVMPSPHNKLTGRRLSVVNTKLFLTGGETIHDDTPVARTEYFDFERNEWIPGKDMINARASHGVAVVTKRNSQSQ